jgi:hypothetical protein
VVVGVFVRFFVRRFTRSGKYTELPRTASASSAESIFTMETSAMATPELQPRKSSRQLPPFSQYTTASSKFRACLAVDSDERQMAQINAFFASLLLDFWLSLRASFRPQARRSREYRSCERCNVDFHARRRWLPC